jgi:hypothetical protein
MNLALLALIIWDQQKAEILEIIGDIDCASESVYDSSSFSLVTHKPDNLGLCIFDIGHILECSDIRTNLT